MERIQVEIGGDPSHSVLGRNSDRSLLYPILLETEQDLREIALTRLEFDILQIFLKSKGYVDNVVLENAGLSTTGRDGTITNCLTRIQEAVPELVIKNYGRFVPGHYLNGEYIHRPELIASMFKNNPGCFYFIRQFELDGHQIKTFIPKHPYLFAPRNVQGEIVPILSVSCNDHSVFADTTPLGLRAIRLLAMSEGKMEFYGLVDSLYRQIPREDTARKRIDVKNSYNLATKLIRLASGESENEVSASEQMNRRSGNREVTFLQWI